MSLRLNRFAPAVVFTAALGLACLPACGKKTKSTDSESPGNPNQGGPPGGNSGRDPQAPQSPVFKNPTTEAPIRAEAEHNLKTIILGMHNYMASNAVFPGGFADKSGKPGLSWRVALLPYIGQAEGNLLKQFKLDEPWDSENNKRLIPMMPKIYAPPNQKTNGYTFYRGFTVPNTWLPPQQPAPAGQAIRGVRITDITDGTSNTVLVAEAYDPVIWTKPDELPFTSGNPPKLGGVFSSGFCAGMADGSVKFFKSSTSAKTIASLIQINDGGIINFDE